MGPEPFQEKSYQKHSEHFNEYGAGGRKAAHAKTWLDKDTVDAWRHQRLYRLLQPVLESDPKAKWLTVGDGRYGKDARFIMENGGDALASDISDVLLNEARQAGYIDKYKKENAESLSFGDAEFDYVFCKESYHHFPRPMLALYEMLRVAGKGVVLIEPNDKCINTRFAESFFKVFKDIIWWGLRRKPKGNAFEESGNYVYGISRREMEKVALGLNYRVISFKGINDAYVAGVEYEKLSANGPLWKKIKFRITLANFLCRIGVMPYRLMAVIIFKKTPSDELFRNLFEHGYQIIHLPPNPYITV